MKIECLIKREGGTSVEMDGQQYHFAPDSDGRHVCEVTDPRHAERFKEITEGYAEVKTAKFNKPAKLDPSATLAE